MAHKNGEYGGIVLHPFKGMGTAFIRGAVLTPEMVADWPLANRRALHDSGRIEWYGPPNPDEIEARESGADNETSKQAPKKTTGRTTRTSKAAKKPAESSAPSKATKPAVKRGGRTK